jgi:hypothetical protein
MTSCQFSAAHVTYGVLLTPQAMEEEVQRYKDLKQSAVFAGTQCATPPPFSASSTPTPFLEPLRTVACVAVPLGTPCRWPLCLLSCLLARIPACPPRSDEYQMNQRLSELESDLAEHK